MSQYSLSMPFVAITDQKASMMIVFDTPYDGSVLMSNDSTTGTYYIRPSFVLEKNWYSYSRKLRYIWLSGDHNTNTKRYREIAKKKSLVITFKEKAKKNPNIDMLLGSVDT